MLMVFHWGTSLVQILEDVGDQPHGGPGREDVGAPGGILLQDVVLHRAPQLVGGDPLLFRHRQVHGQEHGAGALMVMEVDTLSRGMPWKRRSMSARESMATPTLPTSPWARGWSES